MKIKIISVISIITLCSFNVFAQYTYTGISMAYGMGLPVYSLGSSQKTSPSGTLYTLEKGNYGQGLIFGIKGGYMFKKNVGMEIDISYLIGSKKEFITSSADTDTSAGIVTLTEGTATLDKIKMLQLNPSVKLTLGEEVRPYLRMGIMLGLGTGYTRIDQLTITTTGNVNDTTVTEIATDYSGGTAFGFNGAFGVDIDLTDNLVLFGELSISSLSWAATESKITRYIVDGVDLVPSANPASLETEYVDEFTQPFAGSPSSHKELKTHLPFGSFGIGGGVIYRFGNE